MKRGKESHINVILTQYSGNYFKNGGEKEITDAVAWRNHPRALGEGSRKGNWNCRIYRRDYSKIVTRETGTGTTERDRNESEKFKLECSGVK